MNKRVYLIARLVIIWCHRYYNTPILNPTEFITRYNDYNFFNNTWSSYVWIKTIVLLDLYNNVKKYLY